MKITILYSGGLDSRIMYHYASLNYKKEDISCVWFDIGQEYNEKEQASLPSFVEKRKIDWLRSSNDLKSKENKSGNIYIPGRNAVLAMMAASIYLPEEIWLGALQGEIHNSATDKNYRFLEKLNDTMSYVYSPFTSKIKARFPLADMGFGKFESVEWALNNGLSKEEILKTSSCLSGEKGNCGKCIVCARRWGIFGQLGFSEEYNTHPLRSKANLEMFIEMLKGDTSYYDSFRRKEVLPQLYNHCNTRDHETIKLYLEALEGTINE